MSNPARPERPPGSMARTAITAADIRDAGTTMQQMADELEAVGWRRAARTARLHLSSRLNAATLLPRAWRTQQHQGVRNLREHVLARPGVSKR